MYSVIEILDAFTIFNDGNFVLLRCLSLKCIYYVVYLKENL